MTRIPAETPRTQDEILARAVEIAEDDMFGYGRGILLARLDFDHVRHLLTKDATADEWEQAREASPLPDFAASHLAFAMGKASDHRGLTAYRSLAELREIAWLAGLDDIVQAMADAPYENYGVPKLRAFAYGTGLADVWQQHETPGLRRMSVGAACEDACPAGCGR